MSKNVLGIDISKTEIAVAFLKPGSKDAIHNNFTNDNAGFTALECWIKTFTDKPEIYLEATGTYGDAITDYFYTREYTVKVINPLQIKSFAKTKLSRHKTDRVDAGIIAEYGSKFEAIPYKPIETHRQELRALYRCSLSIQEQITHCINHLEHMNSLPESVITLWRATKQHFEFQLSEIEKKMHDIIQSEDKLLNSYNLLQTIKGIGSRTAVSILAELPRIGDFKNARQLAAFLGLTPKHRQSGTSVYGRSKISKMGSSQLRRALFFPAMSAMRFNEYLHDFGKRLESRGKSKKSIICAVMRKLVHIIFGVLKYEKSFDINILAVKK